jgi:Reverse transcriptase (RNA-dependent DNA polymerase)
MFFGMCNSLATFQAMMDSIFSDMIEGRKVIVYMDDILIFGENQNELEERTKQVLQRLREHDLFLKPKKCEFNKTGTSTITGTRSLFETKEMRVQQNNDGIPRTYHSRGKTVYGPG